MGQSRACGSSLEQGNAERILEFLNTPRDSGLSKVQASTGSANAAGPGNDQHDRNVLHLKRRSFMRQPR